MDYLKIAGGVITACFLYTGYRFICNIFFHPLRSYPGPKLWAASTLPQTAQKLKGTHTYALKDLHDTYGEVVRIGPNELSYNTGEAWDAIYGHVKGTKTKSYEKLITVRKRSEPGSMSFRGTNIINAEDADHRRLRRLQSHAFSEKALFVQEPLLQGYSKLFIEKLHEKLSPPSNGVVVMNNWFNFATFDLIGDLAFGESFHCIEKGELHPWIQIIFGSIMAAVVLNEAARYPSIARLLVWMSPESTKQARRDHHKLGRAMAQRRIDTKTDRPDFVSYMLKNNDVEKGGMTLEEIRDSAGLFIVAGSETTATLLSGLTYHLLKNPPILEKLKTELREAFTSADELTLHKIAELPYLNACLEEGLRTYTPVPDTLPRVVPEGGDLICGQFVTGGTRVGVSPWVSANSASNFRNPESFVPERWLGDPLYASDKKSARQTFSAGPRNCIGKNLAYAEMRLLMANLLWHFDLELMEESQDWLSRCKPFVVWYKPDLVVRLRSRF